MKLKMGLKVDWVMNCDADCKDDLNQVNGLKVIESRLQSWLQSWLEDELWPKLVKGRMQRSFGSGLEGICKRLTW